MNRPAVQAGEAQGVDQLDLRSDVEIEADLFEVQQDRGILAINWHMLGGGALAVAGFLYILTALGLFVGTALASVAVLFPWLAAVVMIVATASVLLPVRKKKPRRSRYKVRAPGSVRPTRTTKLTKARNQRILAGVCRGISRWTGIKVLPLRLAFIACTVIPFFKGAGLLLYILLFLVLPKEAREPEESRIAVMRGS